MNIIDREQPESDHLGLNEPEPMLEGEKLFERLQRAVKAHGYVNFAFENKDGCLLVDVQTANVIVEVAKALNPGNREKFLGMKFPSMVTLAWKLVS